MKQEVFVGEGAVHSIATIFIKLKPKRVYLVRGKDSYVKSNARAIVDKLLDGIPFLSFFDFSVNPKIEDVKKGIVPFLQDEFDLIIAIGGGSVLDMAKLIKHFCKTEESAIDDIIIEGRKIGVPPIPLIAVPTTAGTGSEATQFAVVYIDSEKYSVSHPEILPDFSIVDPILTYDSPSYLSACAGFDALAQAIESYWSVNSTTESQEYSIEALELLWNNLIEAVTMNNKAARNKVSYGAFLAGKAINIAKTTAAHALSYNITTTCKLPHGHALAVTLPYFLAYNYKVNDNDVIDKRGSIYVRMHIEEIFKIIGANSPTEATKKMILLIKTLGIYSGISDFDMVKLTEKVNYERLKNNPRLFDLNIFQKEMMVI